MRKYLPIVVLVIGVLLTAVSGLWYWTAEGFSSALDDWRAEQQARGLEIEYEGPDLGGFPFRLTADFGRPRIEDTAGNLWAGPATRGSAGLLDFRHIELTAPGTHRLAWHDGDVLMAVSVTANEARAEARFDERGLLSSTRAEIEDLVAELPKGRRLSGVSARLSAGPPAPQEIGELARLPLALELEAFELPSDWHGPMAALVERAEGRGVLRGLPPQTLSREALAIWRDAGGVLEIEDFELQWGELAARGNGTLTLDRQFRLLGAFSVEASGLKEVVERLAAVGLIKAEHALMLQFGVLALAGGSNPDGRPVVSLPVTLQDGLLFLGPVPILKLKPLL